VSDTDDEFRIRLGRIGNRRGRKAISYVKRVGKIAQKAGIGTTHRTSSFTGSRIGRGYAQGTVSASRRSPGQRRVVIKARIVRIKAGNAGAVRAHLRYVQRDGVTREGNPGELYDEGRDHVDGKAFAERGEGDRHQFRFIVAPEDSGEIADLKPFVRDLMRQMESDLGTRLDWVAADHFNTGHPHSHIVVRGKDDHESDLVIARDYIAHGMRARASELITRLMGSTSAPVFPTKCRWLVSVLNIAILSRSNQGSCSSKSQSKGEYKQRRTFIVVLFEIPHLQRLKS
jgi:hypothetical protein